MRLAERVYDEVLNAVLTEFVRRFAAHGRVVSLCEEESCPMSRQESGFVSFASHRQMRRSFRT